MNFNFTEEQQQLADALRRWVKKDYTFEHRREVIKSDSGVCDGDWSMLTELGMLALPLPHDAGGFDGTAVDTMLVAQELGRGLVVEPYFTTVMGAEFLKRATGHMETLTQVAEGEMKLACALHERQSRYELFDIATRAEKQASGYCINGTKTIVMHGAVADKLIVSARTSGDQRDTSGISLFVIDADTEGVRRRTYKTIDGQRAADIVFDDVQVPDSAVLGSAGEGWPVLDEVIDFGTTALCAEAIGVMEELNQATLEHLKTRKQFQSLLGQFQALQHRMVEMYIELEQARSLTTLAAVRMASQDVGERRRAVSAAKARVGQALKFVGQQAVHLHGGIGVTDELPVAHYFKRGTMIELSLGDVAHHLERFAAQPEFSFTN